MLIILQGSSGVVTIDGAFATTLDEHAAAFQGAVVSAGTFSSTLDAHPAALQGAVITTGTFSTTLDVWEAAFAGSVEAVVVAGTFGAVLDEVVLVLTGAVIDPSPPAPQPSQATGGPPGFGLYRQRASERAARLLQRRNNEALVLAILR